MALHITKAQQDNDLVMQVEVMDALGVTHALSIDGEKMVCEDHAEVQSIMKALGAEISSCSVWPDRWEETILKKDPPSFSQFQGAKWRRVQEIARARLSLRQLSDTTDNDPLAAALDNLSYGALDILPLSLVGTSGSGAAETIRNKYDNRCGKPCRDHSSCQRMILPGSKCPLHN